MATQRTGLALAAHSALGSEWETVTDPIFQNGESFVLTNATTNSTGFFRLELAP